MTGPSPDQAIVAGIRFPTEVALERDEAGWTLVMRRPLRHSPEQVWRMLTEPDRLARWSPIVPDRSLAEVGPASCRENPGDEPIDAEVLVADAPSLLVHRWGTALMRWTVTAVEEGTVLELRQTCDDRTVASSSAAGWRTCFGTLAATFDGVERERVIGPRALDYGWQALHERYEREFAGRQG